MPPAQNEYVALLAAIRTEIELALKPLREDIHELKSSQYTKDVLDEKFASRDERIKRLEDGWAVLLTRVGAGIGAVYGLLYIWNLLHK